MEQQKVWMQKGTTKTSILVIHKANYIKNGWKEVKYTKHETKDKTVKTIVDTTDTKTVAHSRGDVLVDNEIIQAEIIVQTELNGEPDKQELDFIKPNSRGKK